MDLLERYLEAVRRNLPQAQADDIVAELGDDLDQQIEDKEGALGRALDEDEVAAILKERGHPAKVASAYLPQRFLIGPELYPFWRFVIRLVLGWILPPVFALIVGPVRFLTSNHAASTILTTAGMLFQAEVWALGWITLVFALIERTHPRFSLSTSWDPRNLPRRSVSGAQKVPRSAAIGDLVSGVLSGTFLIAFMQHGSKPFYLGTVEITLAPVWQSLAWPFLIVCLASIPLGWIALVRPYTAHLRSMFRVAFDLATGVMVAILLRTDQWAFVAGSASPDARAEVARWIDLSIAITLYIALVVIAGDAIWETWRLLRKNDGRPGKLAGAIH